MAIKRIVAIVFFATMMLSFPMISYADDEICDHDWDYIGYLAVDNEYHGFVYQCTKCGEKKTGDTEKHSMWDEYTYEKCNKTYHYKVQECYICDGVIKTKIKHDYWETGSLSKKDRTYHYVTYKCSVCGEKKKEKEKHYFTSHYKKCNKTYHYITRKCPCGYKKTKKAKHHYSSGLDKTVRKATKNKKAKIKRYCKECGKYKYIYKKWSYKDAALWKPRYSTSYWCTHSTVTKYSRKVKITMDSKLRGAVVKLKIGKKTYKKKLKSGKTIKIRIKKPKFRQKVSIKVYYKGKLIGKDYDSTYIVTPGKKVKVGMTKAEVKYIWGSPDDTSSASGGWSYWFWDDGSYIGFRKGKVKYWYDGAS